MIARSTIDIRLVVARGIVILDKRRIEIDDRDQRLPKMNIVIST